MTPGHIRRHLVGHAATVAMLPAAASLAVTCLILAAALG